MRLKLFNTLFVVFHLSTVFVIIFRMEKLKNILLPKNYWKYRSVKKTPELVTNMVFQKSIWHWEANILASHRSLLKRHTYKIFDLHFISLFINQKCLLLDQWIKIFKFYVEKFTQNLTSLGLITQWVNLARVWYPCESISQGSVFLIKIWINLQIPKFEKC